MDKKIINLKLLGEDDFFVQEAYKVLRTNLQFCGRDIKVIAVTSYNENEGKSTVALQIGKSFAELGKKVLVIDADMRKSVIAGRNTNAKNVRGLSEVLTGMCTFDECVYTTQYETYDLLFAGKYPPNPVELISGKYFDDLLKEVRQRYDYILIDTPPVGQVIDAAVISTKSDGVVLVFGDPRVHTYQAKEMIDQIEKGGCKVLGAVRNNVKKKRKTYYYGEKK